jgi:Flp pilus assembly protein TadG
MQCRLFRRLLKNGRRDAKGSVAIEFALIAPIFFLLLFGIIETTLSWFATMMLENAMKDTARLIRTGQAQNSNMTQQQFRAALCNEVSIILSCDETRLYIDVRSFSNFSSAAFPAPIEDDGTLNPDLDSYNLGGSTQATGVNTIVLARAFYRWTMFTPLIGQFFANLPNNERLLSASVAFRNEPF